jgi:hypothetical protein
MKKPLVLTAIAALCGSLCALPALAIDATWSGFATFGYAQSNSDYGYQRFIDRDGSFKIDTVVAGQVDVRFSPAWSATLQVKAAPAENSDTRWDVKPSWAFVAWRPNNDWLLRAGKLRLPLYLYSESLDVGVSHDMVRLPYEMYSIAPTNDFYGGTVSRMFSVGERDISLDAYAGQVGGAARLWTRDGVPPQIKPGAIFTRFDVKVVGLVLTARDPSLTWRLGVHATETSESSGDPIPTRFPFVALGPGVGYYQVSKSLPGPGIESNSSVHNLLLTAGAEWQIGQGWKVAGEFVSMNQFDTDIGSDSIAGYLALFKKMGNFTPYVSVAGQLSGSELRNWSQRLRKPTLPDQLPGAAAINAAQRLAGENLYAFDQHSVAVGMSYAVTSNSKLKAEWMQTRVGEISTHFDTPVGKADARGRKVNTLSVNFSIAF